MAAPLRLCAFARNGLPYSGRGSREGAKTQRLQGETPTTKAPFNSQKPSTYGVPGFFPFSSATIEFSRRSREVGIFYNRPVVLWSLRSLPDHMKTPRDCPVAFHASGYCSNKRETPRGNPVASGNWHASLWQRA